MNREVQIILLNTVKDKTLSFGCKWINKYTEDYMETVIYPSTSGNFYSLHITDTHFPHISQAIEIIGHPFHYGYAIDWIEKTVQYKDYQTFEDLGGKIIVDTKKGKVDFIVDSTVFSSLTNQYQVGKQATIFLHKQNLDRLYKDKTKSIEADINKEALEYFTNLVKECEEKNT